MGCSAQKKSRAARAGEAHPPFRKGQVLANCGQLGLDWERVSLSGYLEALEAHNEATDPKGSSAETKGPPSDWLRNAVRAQAWG